jgi:hypothetical protein
VKYSLNSRDLAFRAFDPDLAVLKEYLSPSRQGDSQAFEHAVGLLGWLHGFAVARLAGAKMTNGPDVILATPSGNFVVVEATINVSEAAGKPAKLVARAAELRNALATAGITAARVVALFVIASKRSEVVPYIEQGKQLGFAVMAREDIDRAIATASLPPNPEQLFERAYQETNTAKEPI